MSYLLVGDLHLSDRPRDAYRFGIFKWIREQIKVHKPQAVFVMGDICDKKDRHSAQLVNRVIQELTKFREIYLIMGNHDYIDPQNPFFEFLNSFQDIYFITEPQILFHTSKVGIIPHCRTEDEFARCCSLLKGPMDYLLLHQTFEGALAETGVRLSGFSQAPIELLKPKLGAYAGDVHRPQRAASVTYVGAPYHIRFGDDFDPRCILLDDKGKPQNLYFETVRKWALTIRDADAITRNKQLLEGDQVRLTIELAREEAVDWQTHKRQIIEAAKRKGLEIFGIDLKVNTSTAKKVSMSEVKSRLPTDIFDAFCKTENLPSQVKQAGLKILRV